MDHLPALLVVSVVVGLLFIEEVGVPLPMFPADGILLAAGFLGASGKVPLWALVPVLIVADVAGATVGYLWTRELRHRALGGAVRRLDRTPGLRILAQRLKATGPVGVFITRLVPGTRVYTNLSAGLLDVPPRTFLTGMVPASAVWVGVVTVLGAVIGTRVQPYLSGFEALAVDGLVVGAALFIGYVSLRYLPTRGRRPVDLSLPRRRRSLVIGLMIDVAMTAGLSTLFAAISLTVLRWDEPDGIKDLAVLAACTALLYVMTARVAFGATLGEQLFTLDYRRHRLEG